MLAFPSVVVFLALLLSMSLDCRNDKVPSSPLDTALTSGPYQDPQICVDKEALTRLKIAHIPSSAGTAPAQAPMSPSPPTPLSSLFLPYHSVRLLLRGGCQARSAKAVPVTHAPLRALQQSTPIDSAFGANDPVCFYSRSQALEGRKLCSRASLLCSQRG